MLNETVRSSWSGKVNSGARDPIASMPFPLIRGRRSIIANYDARIARLVGAVAQLGERRVRNAKVEGSIPFRSTILPPASPGSFSQYG